MINLYEHCVAGLGLEFVTPEFDIWRAVKCASLPVGPYPHKSHLLCFVYVLRIYIVSNCVGYLVLSYISLEAVCKP